MPKIAKTDAEWKILLTPEQYRVTRQRETERAFTGPYWNSIEKGRYNCICCHEALFASDTKFDAGNGWPSFMQPIAPEAISEYSDPSHGMMRTEIRCTACDAHLGHVFPDGPAPAGLRYSINGHAVAFEAA
jgi:peptide-methionine (R)-S-oxide reductase